MLIILVNYINIIVIMYVDYTSIATENINYESQNENFEIRMVDKMHVVIKALIAVYLHLFLYFDKHGVKISVSAF